MGSRPKIPIDIVSIRRAFSEGQVEWRQHAIVRLLERNISREDVAKIVEKGEIREQYHPRGRLPSCLIFGNVEDKVHHVVIAWNDLEKMAYVVTVYTPNLKHFEEDLKTRRKRETTRD